MIWNACRTFAACLLGFALCTGAHAGTNTWTTKGPPGGYLRAFAASPVDSNIAYVSYWTTLFKTNDGGANWQVLRELKSIPTAFFLDPSDANRFYVVVAGEGILRSNDAGQTYQVVSADTSVSSLGGNSAALYYPSFDNGIPILKRSTDRGLTWTNRGQLPANSLTSIFVDRQNSNIIVGLANGAAFKSADGGMTWSAIVLQGAPANWSARSALVLSPTVILLSTTNGIYRSTNGGANWSLTELSTVESFAIDPNVSNTILAGVESTSAAGRVLRSTDGGMSWSPYALSPNGIVEAVAVKPGSSSQLIIANGLGVLRSSNGGTSWSPPLTQPGAPYVMRLVTGGTSSESKILALSYGRVSGLFSTSLDGPWQRVDTTWIESLTGGNAIGEGALAIKPGNANSLLFLPKASPGFLSQNGGTTWSAASGTEISLYLKNVAAFDPSSPSVVYTKVQPDPGWLTPPPPPPAGIYRSINGGVNWAAHSTNLDPNILGSQLIVDPRNSNRLYLAGRGYGVPQSLGGLYRSVDGGLTWTQSLNGEDVRGVAVNPLDSNRVYVATSSGLQISNDGGDTFNANTGFATLAAEEASAIAIDPIVPTTLYAASQNPADRSMPLNRSSTILRSVDDGLTWEVMRSVADDPEWLVSTLVLDPSLPSMLYVDTEFHGVGSFEVAPDLALAIRGHSGSVPVGSTSRFDLRLENRGSFAATNVRAVATLPAGLANVSVQTDIGACSISGVTVTCNSPVLRPSATMTAQVTYTAQSPMLLPLTATLSAHERDSNQLNNTATATATAGEVVDLGVTVTASSQSVSNGDALVFTVQARNNGPADATSAIVTLTPSSGLAFGATPPGCVATPTAVVCDLGSLATSAIRTLTVSAIPSAVGPASVGVGILPASNAIDSVSSNNTAIATINIVPNGDLVVTIVDSVDPAVISTNFDYQVLVRNEGPDAMTGVKATMVNSGTTIGVTSSQGACAQNVINIACDFGTIGAGGVVAINVKSGSSSAGSISLQVVLDQDGVDRVPSTNSAQEFTAVVNSLQNSGRRSGSMSALDLFALSMLALGPPGFRYVRQRRKRSKAL